MASRKPSKKDEEHRRALDDLQKAVDDTTREGDAHAQKETLRRAAREERRTRPKRDG